MTKTPKIFVFSNTLRGGDGPCLAIAEDGVIVGSHWCSNEEWARHDLGVTSDWHHEDYRAHYPEGFTVNFVSSAEFEGNAELQAALAKEKALSGEPE